MAKRRRTASAARVKTVSAGSTSLARYSAPKPVTIRVAAPAGMAKRARRAGRRARSHAIAGGKKIAGIAQNQLLPVVGAAGLALLQKKGVKIPVLISSLSVAGNAGLIAFAAAKFLKNQTLDHLATGMLSVAAYNYAVGAPVSGDVMGTAVAFDDVDGEDLEGDDE